MPLVLAPITSTDELVWEWVDPTGAVRSISQSASVNVEIGPRGLGLPDTRLAEEKLPYDRGTVVRHGMVEPRVIELPLHISSTSKAGLESLLDTVYGWFATADEQTRTPGYLRLTRFDATQRQIACYYLDGLGGDMAPTKWGDTWVDVVVTLKCPDPHPTAIDSVTVPWASADWAGFNVLNAGQVPAYPIWKITGPATSTAIFNTTGDPDVSFGFGETIAGGTYVIIDTRPASQRPGLQVYDSLGVNRYAGLVVVGTLWPLLAGLNSLSFTSSSTTGDTAVELTYLPRYRSLR
jgi:hypothetical protein